MTIARGQQISLEHTPYYHCTTRCVRRAYLCGHDRITGRNFDHRKKWLEGRLVYVSRIFAIQLLAYAVMSNHYHIVIKISPDEAQSWSDNEVLKRWGQLYKVPMRVTADLLRHYRQRLCDLSWYMRCLNEPMARFANNEDECSGRFWQGRFHCQALLDQRALLKCMAYVDLNPIRAGLATKPELSPHTSIRARIAGEDSHLLPFARSQGSAKEHIPIQHLDYLQLVDWTGRQLRASKAGRIPENILPILERLTLDPSDWIDEMTYFGHWYHRAVGSLTSLNKYCQHLGQQWLKGQARLSAQVA